VSSGKNRTKKSRQSSIPTSIADEPTQDGVTTSKISRLPKNTVTKNSNSDSKNDQKVKLTLAEQDGEGDAALPLDEVVLVEAEEPSQALQITSVGHKDEMAEKPKDKKRTVEASPGLSEDEISVALSKDQYRPRTSRSRSMQMPLNSSNKTKATPSTKPRRRKTAQSDTSTKIEKPDVANVGILVDMGFSPTSASIALEESNGDPEQAISSLVLQTVRSTRTRTSKRGTLAMAEITEKLQDRDIEISKTETNTGDPPPLIISENIRVEIPILEHVEPNTLPVKADHDEAIVRKQRRRVSTKQENLLVEHPDLDDKTSVNVQTHEDEAVILEQPKKKGRGRPRKPTPTEILPQKVKDDPSQVAKASTEVKDTEVTIEQALQEIDANKRSPAEDISVEQQVLEGLPENIVDEDAAPPKSESSPQISEKPKASKVNTSSSSLGKGKSNYRVGLSRNVRIAPLLRIVKK
jgi:hypothetical protein